MAAFWKFAYHIMLTGVMFLFVSGCSSSAKVPRSSEQSLEGTDLRPIGRFAFVEKKLELISSGVHFGVTFSGTKCTIVASLSSWQDHNYLQYELDGVYQKRLRVNTADTIVIQASSSGQHTLRIYKATEAHTGPVFIHNVIAQEVKALPVPESPLIEFIGNSITCGAAADPSEVACGKGVYHDQHNAYMAYGPRVARELKSEFVLSSVSGIGIYRSWNTDTPRMPDVYAKSDFQQESERLWDFKMFNPKVVSIALGTNDLSNGDGKKPRLPFDSVTYTTSYVKFVEVIKSKYPSAQIVLLNSPMIGGSNNDILVACLKRVKKRIDTANPSDKPVALFLFQPMQPRGCSYHPNVEDHEILAEEITPFFRELLSAHR